MKVCKYCGIENIDSASVCLSCGANEFEHKCDNCGTLFDEGNYCPKCGVKVGAKAKKCPICDAEYYSLACPNCGFTNNTDRDTIVYANATTKPEKKRKTWIWVLGWIFVFPIPLTVLMVRNQKLNKWAKIGIIAVSWIIYLAIALVGGSGDDNSGIANLEEDNSQSIVLENSEKTEQTKIVDDEVVNAFLSECEFDYGEIDKGNIRTKFFVHINGCRTELLNSNTDELIVTINGYHIDDINETEVLKAFKMVAQSINGDEQEEELTKLVEGLNQHNTDLYEGQLGNINYKFYPFVEFSKGGVSESRIEIRTTKYN